MIWANLKSFILFFFRPARAVSGLIDAGSWWLALGIFLAVAYGFQISVIDRIFFAYSDRVELKSIDSDPYAAEPPRSEPPNRVPEQPVRPGQDGTRLVPQIHAEEGFEIESVPVIIPGRRLPLLDIEGKWLLWFIPQGFLAGIAAMCLLYVPATIFVLSLLEPIGSFSVALRRDFGTTLTCLLLAWSATHLPFTIAALARGGGIDPALLLLFWLIATVWFAMLATVVLRVVFGCSYGKAAIAVLTSWPSVSLGARVFGYLRPILFSPFILLYLWLIARGEVSSIGSAYRQRQSFRRYLENSTINPRDADAHYQLGLIYQGRHQEAEAEKSFRKAVEIDPTEIDARYQLGRYARQRGQLAEAIEHFGVVVAENDKHSSSEIWREVGATYLGAGMLNEAREALEKYVDRRAFDPEALYYLGETYEKLGRTKDARSLFQRCIESVDTMPYYRRAEVKRWNKLAREHLGSIRD